MDHQENTQQGVASGEIIDEKAENNRIYETELQKEAKTKRMDSSTAPPSKRVKTELLAAEQVVSLCAANATSLPVSETEAASHHVSQDNIAEFAYGH
jgi:hypothetical protein